MNTNESIRSIRILRRSIATAGGEVCITCSAHAGTEIRHPRSDHHLSPQPATAAVPPAEYLDPIGNGNEKAIGEGVSQALPSRSLRWYKIASKDGSVYVQATDEISAFAQARENCQLVPPLAGVPVTDEEAERCAPTAYRAAMTALRPRWFSEVEQGVRELAQTDAQETQTGSPTASLLRAVSQARHLAYQQFADDVRDAGVVLAEVEHDILACVYVEEFARVLRERLEGL